MSEFASTGVEEMWDRWLQAKAKQWEKGCGEYRRGVDSPFCGDAAAEAANEVVDFSNYADQLYREGRISDEERGAWEAHMFEAFLWCERVTRQRGT